LGSVVECSMDKKLNGAYFGICAPTTRVDDYIVVLQGYDLPVILRERPGAPNTYEFISELYLHGFMRGEGVGHFEEQSFEIH